ncbi:DNA (cytosine-5)-methyltransferase 1 [Tamilnaduibacter salinus]|uniref:Cytosine-specific methyltransferase n=2 Tax=Tamilnaduibacter salinus TaxID=1484056 RepID=A0A2U1CYK4_9GAMM|nr:DNA (cytosine-5)-methyltransferase 1 [Tamilnaduibacter salinus]
MAAVEVSETAAKTYKMNHSNCNIYNNDIKSLDPETIMSDLGIEKGELDLLAGCPPCQGFSTHKTRNRSSSVEDERNDLIFVFVEYIRRFLPKAIMLENVPGLAKDYRMFSVMKEISRLGYILHENSLQIKNVADYGVPQRRRRLILVASRLGVIEDPKKIKDKKTVRETISHMQPVGLSGDALHDIPSNRSERIQEIIEMIPKDGGSRKSLPKKYWLQCHIRRPDGYNDVYGRMKWDDVSPTITSGCYNPSKGRFLHPEENRPISLREAALLQSFPSSYRFCMDRGKSDVALMIGNALPPAFISIHAEECYNHLISYL